MSGPGRGELGRTFAAIAACAALVGAGCGGGGATTAAPSSAQKPGAYQSLPLTLPTARLVPDLEDDGMLVLRERTRSHRLAGRLRVTVDDDGAVGRASELLPAGRVVAQPLPTRLGGGFVFLTIGGRGTELWRAADWLGPLEPLASLGSVAAQESTLVAGFDRLYVRLRGNNELVGIDPRTGALLGRGPLPAASSIGEMVFVDGWRGLVDTDLGGLLATTDGGQSWRSVPIEGRAVRMLEGRSGAPIVVTERGAFVVDPSGAARSAAAGEVPALPTPLLLRAPDGASVVPGVWVGGEPDARPPGSRARTGLGKSPLKAALLWGHPDGPAHAVVARGGTLARVELATGRVVERVEKAFTEDRCNAVAYGARGPRGEEPVGFVCGSAGGPTVIYRLERPLALREQHRFATPRVVTESGQGALVVRGGCTDAPPPQGARAFCVIAPSGEAREIRVRGEAVGERVVALADGRTAILVPPRLGAKGQASIVDGDAAKHVVLTLPEEGAAALLEVGLWQEGFVEVAPGELGGWVEAGGPSVGVRVDLATGRVSAGEIVEEPQGLLTAGPRALALGDRGRLLETLDFGTTWTEVDLPRGSEGRASASERRCGPLGCVLPGWLRVGWGQGAEGDLVEAKSPPPARPAALKLSSAPPALLCDTVRTTSKPLARRPADKPRGESPTGWQAFRGVDPPALSVDDVGLDAGAPFDAVPMRAYVWGPKDADWARAGRMQVRFADRYRFDEVLATAPTASPFASRESAAEALGVGAYGYSISWSAARDPERAALLVSACRGRSCALFTAEEGRPLGVLSTEDGAPMTRPIVGSSVRLSSGWYFLADAGVPDTIGLFVAERGAIRRVALLPRLPTSRYGSTPLPRLVRRARTDALGLLYTVRDGPGDRRGTRVVAPVDPSTFRVGAPIELGADLGSVDVDAGCGDRDGWLLELGALEPAPLLTVGGARLLVDTLDLRVRADPGRVCIDGGAVTLGASPLSRLPVARARPAPAAKVASDRGPSFTLVAADAGGAGRSELQCRLRAHAPDDAASSSGPAPDAATPRP